MLRARAIFKWMVEKVRNFFIKNGRGCPSVWSLPGHAAPYLYTVIIAKNKTRTAYYHTNINITENGKTPYTSTPAKRARHISERFTKTTENVNNCVRCDKTACALCFWYILQE